MDETTKKEIQKAWEEVMDGSAPEEFSDVYLEHTGKLFKEVWGRSNQLGRRERRITSLTAVSLSGAASSGVLEYHIKAAVLKGDLTIDELVEWATHLAYYGGWPAAANAYTAIRKVEGELK